MKPRHVFDWILIALLVAFVLFMIWATRPSEFEQDRGTPNVPAWAQ